MNISARFGHWPSIGLAGPVQQHVSHWHASPGCQSASRACFLLPVQGVQSILAMEALSYKLCKVQVPNSLLQQYWRLWFGCSRMLPCRLYAALARQSIAFCAQSTITTRAEQERKQSPACTRITQLPNLQPSC